MIWWILGGAGVVGLSVVLFSCLVSGSDADDASEEAAARFSAPGRETSHPGSARAGQRETPRSGRGRVPDHFGDTDAAFDRIMAAEWPEHTGRTR